MIPGLTFFDGPVDPSRLYVGHYDPVLVLASILVAVFASYAALDVAGRLRAAVGTRARTLWVSVGSISLGGGIWAMHFIGMLALALPCQVDYAPGLTMLSMIPGVLASGVALWLLALGTPSPAQLLRYSVLLGAGIGAMHYAGMGALRIEGMVRYDPWLFVASLVVAVALAHVALVIGFRGSRRRGRQLLAAAVMGCAIAGMHYTAMAAAYFVRGEGLVSAGALPPNILALAVAVVTVSLTGLSMAAAATDRKAALARRLLASETKLRHVLDSTTEGFWVVDSQSRTVEINPAMCAMLQRTPAEVVGRRPSEFADAQNAEILIREDIALRGGGKREFLVSFLKHGGEAVPCRLSAAPMIDASGQQVGAFALVSDMTQILRSEEELRRLAHFDGLTGLANRSLLGIQLAHALDRAERDRSNLAVLVLDLDGFKEVNDSFGHPAGDQLLKTVAARLRQTLRSADTIARLGGDEFAIVLESFPDAEDVAAVARKIITAVAESYALGPQTARVTTSIGIALFPTDGEDEVLLMRAADTAMYAAKRGGRNAYRFHDPAMAETVRQRMLTEQGLRQALEQGGFEVWYQPKIDLRGMRVIGAEALVRWRDPKRGLISPVEFIPIAEETGLIIPMGEWVMHEAARQSQAWLAEGLDISSIAVNLDGAQISRSNIIATVEHVLADTGIEPARLELEITESLLLENAEGGMGTVAVLHEMGISVAIDDFGTGYSSLAYLKYLRADRLKIDRSFVRDLPGAEEDANIARTIIRLADNLGFTPIAEGVETEAQERFLFNEGCFEVQGFRYAKPMPAAEFAGWFRAWEDRRKQDARPA